MKAIINPSKLSGTIKAPPSKSMAHRLLICAGLAEGESIIEGVAFSEDILATLDCLKEMGAEITVEGNCVKIFGASPVLKSEKTFCCRESGSTLRFFLPLLLHSEEKQTFTGYGRLMKRPMDIYEEICREKGLYYEKGEDSLCVCGKLTGGEFTVKGNVSSQFVSGLLFSLALCENDSVIKLIAPVESADYINMTIDAMKSFGVNVQWKNETTLYIKGNQKYKPRKMSVEGDFSNAAFAHAFNLVGGNVSVTGLNEKSLQGDKIYSEFFQKLSEGNPILDVRNCPDLAPVLMAAATVKNGAILTGTKRLRIKESDRAEVMKQELSKFGADITVNEDEVIIKKVPLRTPTQALCSHNDHRVPMSLALVCSLYGGTIEDAECVKKSYPDFFEKMKSLGLEVNLHDN